MRVDCPERLGMKSSGPINTISPAIVSLHQSIIPATKPIIQITARVDCKAVYASD